MVATVDPSSDVVVRFNRAGNAPGVVFRLESYVPGGEWETEMEGTATRFTVKGLPMEPRAFRIVASKNGLKATPSLAAGVYGASAAAPALRLETGGAERKAA